MSNWLDQADFLAALEAPARAVIEPLRPVHVPRGTVLFRPGDEAQAFVVLISGRLGVYLTGRNGREMLLYSVAPGQTCVQTTLGVLGQARYSGEAIAETDASVVMIPRAQFEALVSGSPAFRSFVFCAFASRLSDLMSLLEQVAFVSVGQRLARALLERAGPDGEIAATHQELAVVIGSAREVVSRRLEALSSKGLVESERGRIRIRNRARLQRLAGETEPAL